MKMLIALILLPTNILLANTHYDHGTHMHDDGRNHTHKSVDGASQQVDKNKYNDFIAGLTNAKIVKVDVKGMVCDFCARGIEKTFYQDKLVKKVDVDLSTGKVLIAYNASKIVDTEEIKNIFLNNGQTASNVVVIMEL
tara:strand:- start:3 stop:416 length:414 start_codon:yes stop_codon:yes gene_type:complete